VIPLRRGVCCCKVKWGCKPDSVSPATAGAVAIHLGAVSRRRSSGLPGCLARLGASRASRRAAAPSLFGLAPDGVCQARVSPRGRCALTAPFHPCLIPPSPVGSGGPSAVCFLLRFPSGRPALPLASILPCGVRTFLPPRRPRPQPEPPAGTDNGQRPPAPLHSQSYRSRISGAMKISALRGRRDVHARHRSVSSVPPASSMFHWPCFHRTRIGGMEWIPRRPLRKTLRIRRSDWQDGGARPRRERDPCLRRGPRRGAPRRSARSLFRL